MCGCVHVRDLYKQNRKPFPKHTCTATIDQNQAKLNDKKQALVQEVEKFISEEKRLPFIDNLLGLGLLILIYSELGGGGYWLFQVSYWGYRF